MHTLLPFAFHVSLKSKPPQSSNLFTDSSSSLLIMKTEFKKSIAFAVIISLLTSTYAAFLSTIMRQGLFTDHFLINWVNQIPRIYLFILPFVLITGPLVKAIVDRMFRNQKIQNRKSKTYTSIDGEY